jgi:hypothetical protein
MESEWIQTTGVGHEAWLAGNDDIATVVFAREEDLITPADAGSWETMPCGHDCCQCDSECK